MNSREFQDRLTWRLQRVGLAPRAEALDRLEAYYRLLTTWNQRINLTGLNLSEPTPEALDRLLIEPLVAARHAPPTTRRVVDIGSGGGSPAIPFALGIQGATLLMVESKIRKSVFLREALRAVDLAGSDVAAARFEELLSRPDLHEAHDLLTIRAVLVESRVLIGLQALVKPGGQIFLFRSATSSDPGDAVTPPLSLRGAFPLIESQRSRLIVLDKSTSSP